VVFDSASEGESPIKAKTSRRPSVKGMKSTTVQKATATAFEAKPKPKSKPHLANSKVPKDRVERRSSSVTDISAPSDHNVTVLPEFARSAWSTTFLPTLYARLGCSPDPFVIDADMVKVIQEIVDLVYPDIEYQVQVDDKIFTMVSNRVFIS